MRIKTDAKSSISFTVQQVGIPIAYDIKIENLTHVIVAVVQSCTTHEISPVDG